MTIELRTAEEIEQDKADGQQDEAFAPSDVRIIYYGPHPCDDCGGLICRVSLEQGGDKFDYPEGPIYPNTVWRPHSCKINEKENDNSTANTPVL